MEEPLLSAPATASISQPAHIVRSAGAWKDKLSTILMYISIFLSFQFHKQQTSVVHDVMSEVWAACVNFLIMMSATLGCISLFIGIRSKSSQSVISGVWSFIWCYLCFAMFPQHALPFWESVWPWLTWPLQLFHAIRSHDFKKAIAPIWRPILWGVAQATKLVLPVLAQQFSGLRVFAHQISPRKPTLALGGIVMCVVLVLHLFPLLLIVPWIYTCPLAQIWLAYLKECLETLYMWRNSDGPPLSQEALAFLVCAVLSHALSLWSLYDTSHGSISRLIGVPMDADGFFKDLLEQGGFKAKLERSNSRLIRQVSSRVFSGDAFDVADEDLTEKRKKLKEDCLARQENPPLSLYPIGPIDRANLLDSSFKYLRTASNAQLLANTLVVTFQGEVGIDQGGVTRDWFDSFAKALLQGSNIPQGDLEAAQGPGGESLLAQTTDRTLLPRPSGYTEEKLYVGSDEEAMEEARVAPKEIQERWEKLATIGRVVAAAVLRGHSLPLSFGNVLARFLCEKEISYNDVRHLDPEFFKHRVTPLLPDDGLQKMNEALGEPLTFMSAATEHFRKTVPLIPGGDRTEVTDDTKRDYIQKLSEARLCNGRRRELRFFIGGFHKVIPVESLRVAGVSPNELSVLISGVQTYDVTEWKANTIAPPNEQVVEWFWEVLESYDEETKAKVLHFVTGSSRLPPGGFAELTPRFRIAVAGDHQHLPISHTCACQIDVPRYASKSDLASKLMLSLQNSTGFGSA